jgi:hypothetical protein
MKLTLFILLFSSVCTYAARRSEAPPLAPRVKEARKLAPDARSIRLRHDVFALRSDEFAIRVNDIESGIEKAERSFHIDPPPFVGEEPLRKINSLEDRRRRIRHEVRRQWGSRPNLPEIDRSVSIWDAELKSLYAVASADDRLSLRSDTWVVGLRDSYADEGARGRVQYLTDAERVKRKLSAIAGALYVGGKPLDTGTWSAIFVVDELGDFYASTEQALGSFHHSSLSSGKPVAAAGEIEVKAGKLIRISDRSGHYFPPRMLTERAIARLSAMGVKMDGVKMDFTAPIETSSLHDFARR